MRRDSSFERRASPSSTPPNWLGEGSTLWAFLGSIDKFAGQRRAHPPNAEPASHRDSRSQPRSSRPECPRPASPGRPPRRAGQQGHAGPVPRGQRSISPRARLVDRNPPRPCGGRPANFERTVAEGLGTDAVRNPAHTGNAAAWHEAQGCTPPQPEGPAHSAVDGSVKLAASGGSEAEEGSNGRGGIRTPEG